MAIVWVRSMICLAYRSISACVAAPSTLVSLSVMLSGKMSGTTSVRAFPCTAMNGEPPMDCARATGKHRANTPAISNPFIDPFPSLNSQTPRRFGHRPEQGAAFVHGLFPLRLRVGVVDHAAAGLDIEAPVLDHRGADGDRGVGVAVPTDVADRAGIHVALDRFELADDLQRADLGR